MTKNEMKLAAKAAFDTAYAAAEKQLELDRYAAEHHVGNMTILECYAKFEAAGDVARATQRAAFRNIANCTE